jgi:hypothetical protein
MVFMKIQCPEFNCERTLKMKNSATVAEVIYRFSRKVSGLSDISLYGLYTSNSSPQLMVSKTLAQLQIRNLSGFIIRLHGEAPNVTFKEKIIFGICPSKMNLIQPDSGEWIDKMKSSTFLLIPNRIIISRCGNESS